MKLPRGLVIILVIILLVLIAEAGYYLYLTNRPSKVYQEVQDLPTPAVPSPQIIIENQISSLSAVLNPRFTQDDLVDLLDQYGKKTARLVIVDDKSKIPRAPDGTVASEVEAETKQVSFEAMAIYGDKEVSFYIHPNLAIYFEGGQEDLLRLGRLFSYQLLKVIIASDNNYLFSGKTIVEIPEEIVIRFLEENPLVLVTLTGK